MEGVGVGISGLLLAVFMTFALVVVALFSYTYTVGADTVVMLVFIAFGILVAFACVKIIRAHSARGQRAP